MLKPRRYFVLFFLLPLVVSCSKQKEEEPSKKSAPVVTTAPLPKKDTVVAKALPENGLYKAYKLTGAQALVELTEELGPKKMTILYKINRRDLKHLKQGETIAVPNSSDSESTYSPFPLRVYSLDSVSKVLMVSRRVQAFAAYEHGNLVEWGPTSTGKKATPTPEGLYHTNWKSKETHSTVDDAWVLKWYFNLDNLEGISLHEYDLPGYPASHSCVRLLADDAQWIYNWAEQWKLSADRKTVATEGTPVIVFGDYAYGKTPPWKKLTSDSSATSLSDKEVTGAVARFLPQKKVQLSSQ
ncbi:MAG: L,D-transpeptidase [Bacteroidota bacterium]|nr:L,D-transpeptidase [Bacteroidota bacterium]MDP4228896.1 L,D-transpeptidase [Bacteroidota bacterium]